MVFGPSIDKYIYIHIVEIESDIAVDFQRKIKLRIKITLDKAIHPGISESTTDRQDPSPVFLQSGVQ
jgi:hypothetical protein